MNIKPEVNELVAKVESASTELLGKVSTLTHEEVAHVEQQFHNLVTKLKTKAGVFLKNQIGSVEKSVGE